MFLATLGWSGMMRERPPFKATCGAELAPFDGSRGMTSVYPHEQGKVLLHPTFES